MLPTKTIDINQPPDRTSWTGHTLTEFQAAATIESTPTDPQLGFDKPANDTAPKLTKPGFGGFGTLLPAYFGKSIPETTKQLDAVDADEGRQGLVTHGLRRPRRVRRVQLEFSIPRVGPLCGSIVTIYLPGKFIEIL